MGWTRQLHVVNLLMKRIFEQYKQPFALTYLGISLMVVYLPIAVLKDWICSLMEKNLHKNFYNDSPFLSSSIGLNLSLRNNDNNDMHYTPEDDIKNCLISDTDFKQVEEGQSLTHKNMDDESHLLLESTELSSWEIAKWSIYLTPIWFVTEYLSNLALANTSVASTTVLTSTSGLFTLFFGALLGQDSISTAKIIAVCISMTGVVMTTIGKTWAPDEILSASESVKHSIMGDIFGLLSAVVWFIYSAAQKVFQIGRRHGGRAEVFWIRWTFYSSWLLVAWALSVVWTTPLVATLGMSLTIPLAMVADMVVHGRHFSAIYILGCIQVFAGFVIANLSDKHICKEDE